MATKAIKAQLEAIGVKETELYGAKNSRIKPKKPRKPNTVYPLCDQCQGPTHTADPETFPRYVGNKVLCINCYEY